MRSPATRCRLHDGMWFPCPPPGRPIRTGLVRGGRRAARCVKRLGGESAAQLGLLRRPLCAPWTVLLSDSDGCPGFERPVQLDCVATEPVGREHPYRDRTLVRFDDPELIHLAARRLRQPVHGHHSDVLILEDRYPAARTGHAIRPSQRVYARRLPGVLELVVQIHNESRKRRDSRPKPATPTPLRQLPP